MLHIADWLNRLGMSRYAERFVENDVDFSVLRHLTDQHLKDLGVSLRSPVEDAAREPSNSHCDRAAAAGRCRVTQLTVMFCDLVGSTALSARLDPEELRGIINAIRPNYGRLVNQIASWSQTHGRVLR